MQSTILIQHRTSLSLSLLPTRKLKKDKMSEITKMSFKIDKKIIKVAQDSEQGILPDEGKEGWTKDKGTWVRTK